MKRVLFVVAALGLAALASPASADVSNGRPVFDWTNPTTWVDGSPMSESQISGYMIDCSGPRSYNRRVNSMPYQLTENERLENGQYVCTLTLYARVTPTSNELASEPSNAVSFIVPQSNPSAVADFSAN